MVYQCPECHHELECMWVCDGYEGAHYAEERVYACHECGSAWAIYVDHNHAEAPMRRYFFG